MTVIQVYAPTSNTEEAETEPFYEDLRGFPHGSEVKASAWNAGDLGSIPGLGRSPEKEMEIHSSTLAWKIPWMEGHGSLQS